MGVKMDMEEKLLFSQLLQNMSMILKPDENAMEKADLRLDQVRRQSRMAGMSDAELGLLGQVIIRMAGAQAKADVKMDKKAQILVLSDHLIAEDPDWPVTEKASMTEYARKTLEGKTVASLMARKAGMDLFTVDAGLTGQTDGQEKLTQNAICDRRVRNGCGDVIREPAMSTTECLQAMIHGIEMVSELSDQGYQLLAFSEMNGNAVMHASCLIAVLLNVPVEEVMTRSGILGEDAWQKEIALMETAIARYWQVVEETKIPDGPYFQIQAGIKLIAQLGSPEIAMMVGICLGGALFNVPIVLDGIVSEAAALCIFLICQRALGWILPSHIPSEPGADKVLKFLHLPAAIQAGMPSGQGYGAAAAAQLYELALMLYENV